MDMDTTGSALRIREFHKGPAQMAGRDPAHPLASDASWRRRRVALALTLIVAVGFWLRVRHLGDLGLVGDEGYQVHAVQGILQHGIPKPPSGRIYARAFPFSYAEAAAARLFGLNEFSLRLPAVVFGVGALLAAYLLATTLFGWRIGLWTAALLACSSWEIELSRYARFYTAFQCMYLLSLWCFYRGIMRGERAYRVWFLIAAVASLLFHDLGLVLVTLCLIPMASPGIPRARTWWAVASAASLVVLWGVYRTALGLVSALGDVIPSAQPRPSQMEGLAQVASWLHGMVLFPPVRPVLELLRNFPWLFGGLFAMAIAATAYLSIRGSRGERWRAWLAVPMIWAAFLHQFLLVGIFLAFYGVWYVRSLRNLLAPSLKVVYGITGIFVLFWVSAMVGDPTFRTQLPERLFGYPALYPYFLSWFIKGWPYLTVAFGIGVVGLVVRAVSDPLASAPRFVLGAFFLPLLLASVLSSEHYSSRYAFHLYPLMVMAVVWLVAKTWEVFVRAGTRRGVRVATGLALVVVLLGLNEDFHPAKAWAIGNRTYGSAKDPVRGAVTWKFYAQFHHDHKTPGLYVRERATPDDLVIAVGPAHMTAAYQFYAGRVDVAVPGEIEHYHLRLRDGTIRGHVTGSRIIDTLPALQQYLDGHSKGDVWLLVDGRMLVDENPLYAEPLKGYLKRLVQHPVYVGEDGQSYVVNVR